MWRLDFGREAGVVRVGALAVELWQGSSTAMRLVAREPLSRRGSLFEPQALAAPLAALAGELEGRRASLVLESTFVPLLLADTGGALTTRSQLEALLRHRFAMAYGTAPGGIERWAVRADYRFGTRFALGFAMPPAVAAVLSDMSRSTGLGFTAWLPGFAWGADRFKPWKRWAHRTGWWTWQEQDRSIVSGIGSGRIQALNPAAPLHHGANEVARAVAIERVRSGVGAPDGPVAVGQWERADNSIDAPGDVLRFSVEGSPVRGVSPSRDRRLHMAAG